MKEMTGDEWEQCRKELGPQERWRDRTGHRDHGGSYHLCPYHWLGSELTVCLGIYSIYTTTGLQNISILGLRKQTQEW